MAKINLGQAFGMALCEHFGLPKDQVQHEVKLRCDRDEVLSVTVEIALTADDLVGIAMRMGAAGVSLDRLPVVSHGGGSGG